MDLKENPDQLGLKYSKKYVKNVNSYYYKFSNFLIHYFPLDFIHKFDIYFAKK
jgi:hypothetical protein